jgi:hypothetical protein
MKKLTFTDAQFKREVARIEKCHAVWHQFADWLTRTYGKDLHGEWTVHTVGKKTIKSRSFDNNRLMQRLVGYDVSVRIERYVKRYLPAIKVLHCDDAVYACSIILLIPHAQHGITVLYIPQCTSIQNQLFLYKNHSEQLLKEIAAMKKKYKV